MNYGLEFIRDEDLYNHIRNTILKYRFKIDLKKLNNNLIDPIKLTFDSAIYQGDFTNKSLELILEKEVHRQIDKSNTNHIGYFHQNIFNYIGKENGWTVPKQGFDIENKELGFYIEMKNKHNTMNSSSSAKTFMKMQNQILKNPNAICMLVEVIAKNSQNTEWVCTIDEEKFCHSAIRRVSIDKFYEIVTGNKDAFLKLCLTIPKVIKDVLLNESTRLIENSVIEDLRSQEIENILESLYLFTFKKYQGFNNFKLEI